MLSRAVALALAVLVAGYLVVLGQTGLALLATAEPAPMALGVAVLAFPVLGAWAIWSELRFGFAMARMTSDLGPDPLPDTSPADLERRRDYAEVHSDDWDAWYRLALAYDASRNRRQARQSMVCAWRLSNGKAGR
ncbi:MAG: hypothetical protein U0990_05575 [Candidatus Nanopelagicales bacterium]|nr:hypothetical protein [Candidatus Nanopelagicales bacterium]MDZ4249543.1 hypothetical protein [Candidatus Nanopelagicales bacterium]